TVHTSDEEAAALWREVTDIGADRISRFDKENFWEMGDTGPCGPCSAIHTDRGPAACNMQGIAHRCEVNGDCDRFVEIWNLVFIQYDRDASGTLSDLPAKHVDTGMGFERIAAVLEDVPSNYQIDVFREIIAGPGRRAGKRYGADPRDDVSLNVIADHVRAVTFLVAEGIVPSNEGRGYVLRRLLRRAARHGKLLGLERPFLHEVVRAVVATMGGAYPEIARAESTIREAVRTEEERFAATLDRGLTLLAGEVERARQAGSTSLPGEVAFKLYDTYGFPLDLTEDILRGEGMVVDRAAFDAAMASQRERGRSAQRFADAPTSPDALETRGASPVGGPPPPRRCWGRGARAASSATTSSSGSRRSWRSSRTAGRRAARCAKGRWSTSSPRRPRSTPRRVDRAATVAGSPPRAALASRSSIRTGSRPRSSGTAGWYGKAPSRSVI